MESCSKEREEPHCQQPRAAAAAEAAAAPSALVAAADPRVSSVDYNAVSAAHKHRSALSVEELQQE